MDSPSSPPLSDFAHNVVGTTDVAGQTTDEGRGRIFPCDGCGADLHFHIGQQKLQCPYCGHTKAIELGDDAVIREQDFHAMLAHLQKLHDENIEDQEAGDQNEVRCESCGANVVFVGTLTSSFCPYCGSPIQRERVHKCNRRVPVDAVLPFLVEEKIARGNLSDWVQSRWFAPNDFRKHGVDGHFHGVYLPYWTFDTLTFTQYSGMKGVYYYVTVGSGKNRRTERRTRWYPASGSFQRFFDDVLVPATENLSNDMLHALEPWPLAKCLPFNQQVLAGHFARTYDVELAPGFVKGRALIDAAILREVRQRIGGDTQRVHSVNSRYDGITYKHALLPVWLLAYRYRDKSYQVFVNAATGEVQGERPYSWIKITLAVVTGLAAVAAVVFFMNQ